MEHEASQGNPLRPTACHHDFHAPTDSQPGDRRAYGSNTLHMSLKRDMRFHEALTPVLGSPSKIGLLRTMFTTPERSWTGRELARASKVSPAQAARGLSELADTSVVAREVVGRSYAWRLRPSHVLFATLTDLFRWETECRATLLKTIHEGLRREGLDRARVFGSVSRGEERGDSDVDLFLEVVTERDRERVEAQLERLRSRVWNQFGNPLAALVYTRAEAAHPKNPELLRSIARDGLDVSGEG
jgi:predicted nucleotidyltransferase